MKRSLGINVGSSSILVVFVLLCLTTFAALSLVSANADRKLAQKAADFATRYYEADSFAEELIASLDVILRESYAITGNEQDYRSSYAYAFAKLSHHITLDGTTASFSVEIGDTQRLDVTLALPYPEQAGDYFYRRLQWQVVSTAVQDEDMEEGLNLWAGPGM